MTDWTVSWTSWRGTISINGGTYTLLDGFTGWGLTEYDIDLQRYGDGLYKVDEVLVNPRELDLPILIQSSSQTGLETAFRDLCKIMTPDGITSGDLSFVRGDGTVRVLTGILKSGAFGTTKKSDRGKYWQRAVLTFLCPDPYWKAQSNSITHFYGSVAPTFFPFFPLVLGGNYVYDAATITNSGDVSVWPLWMFGGPGTSPGARNVTTGKRFSFTGLTLVAGDVLWIDTAPGVKAILLNYTTNLFPYLDAGSELFELPIGDNDIIIEFADTTGSSTASERHKLRYFSL